MNKKIISAVLLIVAITCSVFYWNCRDGYYAVVPIKNLENAYYLPSMRINIQGIEYELNIDTGTEMALSLDIGALENIEREKVGNSRRLDFRGHQYTTPKYKISGVKVGDLSFSDIQAREESSYFDEHGAVLLPSNIQKLQVGRIGRDLLFQKKCSF